MVYFTCMNIKSTTWPCVSTWQGSLHLVSFGRCLQSLHLEAFDASSRILGPTRDILCWGPTLIPQTQFLHKWCSPGTARSHIEDRLHSWSASHFSKAQDCLWHSEENIIGDLCPPVPGDLHRDKLNKGLRTQPYSILQLVSIKVPWERRS